MAPRGRRAPETEPWGDSKRGSSRVLGPALRMMGGIISPEQKISDPQEKIPPSPNHKTGSGRIKQEPWLVPHLPVPASCPRRLQSQGPRVGLGAAPAWGWALLSPPALMPSSSGRQPDRTSQPQRKKKAGLPPETHSEERERTHLQAKGYNLKGEVGKSEIHKNNQNNRRQRWYRLVPATQGPLALLNHQQQYSLGNSVPLTGV